jgi:hypothetical protein
MNPSNPYDGIDLGTVYFKPENPGETITITVAEIKQVAGKNGSGVEISGEDVAGVSHSWTGWNQRAKGEIARERPLIGDTLLIRYDGRDPEAENEAMAARWFTLKVLARAGDATPVLNEPPEGLFDDAEPPELDDEDIDFGAAA